MPSLYARPGVTTRSSPPCSEQFLRTAWKTKLIRSSALKWPNQQQLEKCLESSGIAETSNDGQFLRRVFSGGPTRYIKRIRRLGFEEKKSVLDAGSGFGQWTIVFAQMNQSVLAFDASPVRIKFLDSLLQELDIENVHTSVCSLPDVPPEYDNLDGIFCFGTIFISPWISSLEKLSSILAPQGTLYVNANDIGWHLYLYETDRNKTADYNPGDSLLDSLARTRAYKRGDETLDLKGQIIISRPELRQKLEDLGFASIRQGRDGQIHNGFLRGRFLSPQLFPARYKGFDAVHESLAKR